MKLTQKSQVGEAIITRTISIKPGRERFPGWALSWLDHGRNVEEWPDEARDKAEGRTV